MTAADAVAGGCLACAGRPLGAGLRLRAPAGRCSPDTGAHACTELGELRTPAGAGAKRRVACRVVVTMPLGQGLTAGACSGQPGSQDLPAGVCAGTAACLQRVGLPGAVFSEAVRLGRDRQLPRALLGRLCRPPLHAPRRSGRRAVLVAGRGRRAKRGALALCAHALADGSAGRAYRDLLASQGKGRERQAAHPPGLARAPSRALGRGRRAASGGTRAAVRAGGWRSA